LFWLWDTPVDEVHAAVDAEALGRGRTLAHFFVIFFRSEIIAHNCFFMGDLQRFTNRQYERLLGFSRKLDNRDFLKQIAKLCWAPAGFFSSADLFLQQTRCRPHEHLSNQR